MGAQSISTIRFSTIFRYLIGTGCCHAFFGRIAGNRVKKNSSLTWEALFQSSLNCYHQLTSLSFGGMSNSLPSRVRRGTTVWRRSLKTTCNKLYINSVLLESDEYQLYLSPRITRYDFCLISVFMVPKITPDNSFRSQMHEVYITDIICIVDWIGVAYNSPVYYHVPPQSKMMISKSCCKQHGFCWQDNETD